MGLTDNERLNDENFLYLIKYRKEQDRITSFYDPKDEFLYVACIGLPDIEKIFDAYLDSPPENYWYHIISVEEISTEIVFIEEFHK
jgi:hypothetical protein